MSFVPYSTGFRKLRTLPTIFSSVALVLALCSGVQAQNEAVTPLGMKPGAPNGSYVLSNIDSVSLFNGRVHIKLPLINEVGRGDANSQMAAAFDTPAPWHVLKYIDYTNNWAYATEPSPYSAATYLIGGEYSIKVVATGDGVMHCQAGAFGDDFFLWTSTLTRVYLVDRHGVEHEMRDVATGGEPRPFPGDCWSPNATNRGRKFVTTDGFGATYISDGDIRDSALSTMEPIGSQAPGWLLLKNGKRIRISYPDWVSRDRNGNLFIPGKDSLNRTVSQHAGLQAECTALFGAGTGGCGYFSYKGFGGTERKLWSGSESTQEGAYVLPNGGRYKFFYNTYGDVTRIDLPTGSSIEYEYAPGLTGTQPDFPWVQGAMPGLYSGGQSDFYIYRRVTERRVYREGHVLESKQTFSRPESTDGSNAGFVETKQYDGNNNLLKIERHYFYGSASQSFTLQALQYPAWRVGREYRAETFDAAGNLLRRTDHTWEQRTWVSWWNGNQDDAPQNDPRVEQTVTYLENGQSSTTTYDYDPYVPYNSVTDVRNYGYDGALLRHTQTTYLKTLNGIDYTGSNIQSGTSPHLRDFPIQVSIYDGSGIERARATNEYDNYNSDTNHEPLVDRPGISGLDPTFNSSYTPRGNITARTNYLLVNGSVTHSVTSYAQYDIAGNVVKAIDPRGCATTLDFSDRFGAPDGEARGNSAPVELSSVQQSSFAFATTATNCLGQTSYAQFDFYIGQPVDGEDANGIVSSGFFNDPLDRATQLVRAANGGVSVKSQATFSYNDVDRIVTTTTDRDNYGDNILKTQTLYDGLGRTIETRQYEDGDYIAIKHVPYVVLQDGGIWFVASQVSNPFRPHLSEQPVWTTSYNDTLARVVKVKTPDNAIISTTYSGNAMTVTDQGGKQRRSVKDALGRLTHIYEAPTESNYLTSYGYDTLDNLTSVTQSGQVRTFVFDSLKRLTSANNPENGTVSYQYDDNANLLVKTDARGVSTHYEYDALNRVTRLWYNGSSSITETTNNSPALPSGVGASDEAKYFYDSQSLPAGAPPNFVRGFAIGKLVATTYGAGSAGNYFEYDALSKQSRRIQQISGINYETSATYNLAGAMILMTYPSNRTVAYAYDGSGRTKSVTGFLGDGNQRTYATGISYSAFGGLQEEQFGTAVAVYHKQRYNVRGQVWDVRASTVSFASDPANGDRGAIVNYYSSNFTQGGSGADNNGNLLRQEAYVPGSSFFQDTFDYDPVNRLSSIAEKLNGTGTDTFTQAYAYDRYGNRSINSGGTSGGVNNNQAAVVYATITNRMYAPDETEANHPLINYDAAGNQTRDYYTYSNIDYDRTYDAENKIKTSTASGSFGTQQSSYSYDADGQRTKRLVNGTETWQVYGLGGELIAEYASNAAPSNPQKEYGYRNGELLITARLTTGWGAPPALSDNPLVVNETAVKAQHITELRNAINSLRSHVGQSAYPWQYSATTSDYINANPILEMRTALDQALGPGTYAPGLATGQPVKAIHIQELRTRVLDAWQSGTGGVDIRWLVMDQVGTPRMVFDQSGSLAGVSRHDYLPFGEEVPAGFRANVPGYTASDGVRQHFTSYERDSESELDYAQARYYASLQGRFTGVDPISGRAANPQTWNRYTYAGNNPMKFIDPSGMSYFMGSGANDPWIRENAYRVDGFDMGPDGTASKLTDESMLTYSSVYLSIVNRSSTPDDGNDYGVVLSGGRSGDILECWLETRWGTKIWNLGQIGVGVDVTEVVIGHSLYAVGEERDSTTQPMYGKWGNDDRAHIIAKALGGGYMPGNLTSQAPSVNRGPVKAFENSIRKTLTANKEWQAHLKVEIFYRTPDCDSPKYRTAWYYRPTEFKYSVYYTHQGARVGAPNNLHVRNPVSWRDFF